MENLRTNIDNHGKILIPIKLRKELNFKQGDTLVIRRIDNELRLISLKSAIKNIQDVFKKRSNLKNPAVEEFLEVRRKESEIEKVKMNILDDKK